MKKGCDFWISENIPTFLIRYWLIYSLFHLIAISITIFTKNPFTFLIVGFIPCPIIWIYRAIHNPYYKLEEYLERYVPEFYKVVLDRSKSIKHSKHRRSVFLLSELMRAYESIKDQKIIMFVQNIRRVDQSGTIGFSIWFLTFMVLVFLIYLIRL